MRGAGHLSYADPHMRNLVLALLHLAVVAAKLCGAGGVRAVMAENLLLKQQLIVLRRVRRRAPNLTRSDRLLCGFWSLFLSPTRIRKAAIVLRPSTLLTFHQALVRRKYRRLFSSRPDPKKPGPKGPDGALIQAIVELKSRNPRFGCPRIARIISLTFGVDVDKNVVHRVLSNHYRPAPGGSGPSWLSFIGHTTDSLWSVDLFRCESIVLRTYWVLVVMDQFTRRLVGVGVHCGAITGVDLTTIDALGVETVNVILSEYGWDLSRFPTEKQFISHLRLAPHRAMSGGKPVRNQRKQHRGSARVTAALRMAATSLRRSQSALGAYYRRIAQRLGADVAVFATARKLAQWVYRVLRWGQAYVDEGAAVYEKRYRQARMKRLADSAKQLGYTLVPAEA